MKETLLNGYEEIYQVSNAGRFKSVNRIGKDRRILKEKIKIKNGDPYGFTTIKLYKDSTAKNYRVS